MNIKQQILFSKQQLSGQLHCDLDTFNKNENSFFESDKTFFSIVTFGKNAIFLYDPILTDWCIEKFSKCPVPLVLGNDMIYEIQNKLREYGKKLSDEKIHYLYVYPEKVVPKLINCSYKFFDKNDVRNLYVNSNFPNALNYKTDVMAVGAYYKDELVALAAADNDNRKVWRVGVDTLTDYRGQGLATYLIKSIADEISKRHVVVSFMTNSSNITASKVALNAGFFPVWMEYSSMDV